MQGQRRLGDVVGVAAGEILCVHIILLLLCFFTVMGVHAAFGNNITTYNWPHN